MEDYASVSPSLYHTHIEGKLKHCINSTLKETFERNIYVPFVTNGDIHINFKIFEIQNHGSLPKIQPIRIQND